MRLDWDMSPADKLLVTADYYDGREKTSSLPYRSHPAAGTGRCPGSITNFAGGSALARWSHAFSATSDLNLQIYYDGYNQRAERSTSDRLVKNS